MTPAWVVKWLAAAPSSIHPVVAAELCLADERVGDLALRFPPYSVVVEKEREPAAPQDSGPAPSSRREATIIGYVTGYRLMPFGEAWLAVCPEPGSQIAILASPDGVRVHGFRPGHGPGHVRAILGRTAA
jgi:hypothetical protein